MLLKQAFCFLLFFELKSAEPCAPTDLNQCTVNAYCDETTHTCQCRPGFILRDANCVPAPTTPPPVTPTTLARRDETNKNNSSGGSVAAGVLIPLCILLLVIYGVWAARRYGWVGKTRAWLWRRRGGAGNYDGFMIDPDDDDPPLR